MYGFPPGTLGRRDKTFLARPIPKRSGATYGHAPWRRRLAHGSLKKKYKFYKLFLLWEGKLR
jgi:hypothetical protein